MGKKKHRPKSKAELLQAQWERERPRPKRPAAGWMQAAAERANRAQAAVIARRKEEKRGEKEQERPMEKKTSFLAEASAIVERAPVLLPDTGREASAIGGLPPGAEVPGKQGAGKVAFSPSAILERRGMDGKIIYANMEAKNSPEVARALDTAEAYLDKMGDRVAFAWASISTVVIDSKQGRRIFIGTAKADCRIEAAIIV